MLVKTQSYYCQHKTRPLKPCLLNLTLMNKATLYAIENRTQTYSHCWSHICIIHLPKLKTTCTVSQCVTVPKILNHTDTDTFLRYQIFSLPKPVLFLVPIFSDNGSETFFRYQIFAVPVPIPPEKIKKSRYRYP